MSVGELYQGIGGTNFPLDPEDFADSLAALDPTRDRLLELFAAAINHEFGDVWAQALAALPPKHRLEATFPVQDKLPFEPSAQLMGQRKTAFPLLCLHRTGSPTYEEFLIDQVQVRQQWLLHYVLGPLDIEGVRKVADICQGIGKLIALVIRQRGHVAYEDGALQFFPGTGGLSSVRLVNQLGFGEAQYGGDESHKLYWSTIFTLETTEVATDDLDADESFEPLDRIEAVLSVGDGTETYPDLIEGHSDVPVEVG